MFDECDLHILRIRILNQPCLTTVVSVCTLGTASPEPASVVLPTFREVADTYEDQQILNDHGADDQLGSANSLPPSSTRTNSSETGETHPALVRHSDPAITGWSSHLLRERHLASQGEAALAWIQSLKRSALRIKPSALAESRYPRATRGDRP